MLPVSPIGLRCEIPRVQHSTIPNTFLQKQTIQGARCSNCGAFFGCRAAGCTRKCCSCLSHLVTVCEFKKCESCHAKGCKRRPWMTTFTGNHPLLQGQTRGLYASLATSAAAAALLLGVLQMQEPVAGLAIAAAAAVAAYHIHGCLRVQRLSKAESKAACINCCC